MTSLLDIAAAERDLRARRAVNLVTAGKMTHADADEDAQVWRDIVDWLARRDAQLAPHSLARLAPPAIRVAAAAMRTHVRNPDGAAAAARAWGLTNIARSLAIKAQIWCGDRAYVDDYLAAMRDVVAGMPIGTGEADRAA